MNNKTKKGVRKIKAWAIVWSRDIFPLKITAMGVVSLHLDKPVVTQDKLWKVVPCEVLLPNQTK